MLAYSSISHIGFILIGFTTVSQESITSILMYIIIYLFMTLPAFYMTILVQDNIGNDTLESWSGLAKNNPVLSVFMVISLVSLAGLPPTAGFIGKVYLLAALIEVHQFYWLAIVAIINTVISLFYYFNLAKSMYFLDSKEESKIPVHPVFMFAIFICALPTSLLIINWNPLYKYIESSILPLIGG